MTKVNFNLDSITNFPSLDISKDEKSGDISIGGEKYNVRVLGHTSSDTRAIHELADMANQGKDISRKEFISRMIHVEEQNLSEAQVTAIFDAIAQATTSEMPPEILIKSEASPFTTRMKDKYDVVHKRLVNAQNKYNALENKVSEVSQNVILKPINELFLKSAKEDLQKRKIERLAVLTEWYQGSSTTMKNPASFLNHMFISALDARHLGYLKNFLNDKEDSSNDLYYFYLAILANDPAMIDELIKETKVDPNHQDKNGFSFLEGASLRGSRAEAAIQTLLRVGAKVEVYGRYSPVHEAFRSDLSVKTAELLLNQLTDINLRAGESKASLLHKAISYEQRFGKSDKVDLLLKRGIDVNLQTTEGMTPLHHLIELSQRPPPFKNILALVRKLIAHGAVVDLRDINSQTALHFAAQLNKSDLVLELLKAGANPNLRDADGRTALHYLVSHTKPNKKILDTLLKAPVDINAQDENGNTPLHLAVEAESKESVIWLLEHGAQPMVRNREGKLPGEHFLIYSDAFETQREIRELLGKPPKP